MSFFKKLKESISSKTENVTKQFRDGLEKTRKGFIEKVSDLVIRRKKSMKNSTRNWKRF